jgi:hypothetical protein
MRRTVAVLALAYFMVGGGTARGESIVYVAGSGNEFGTINLKSGAFTPIGTLALPAGDHIFGMGFASEGNLYGLDSRPDAHLFRIDTTQAQLTDLGAVGLSAVDATADASGKLYAFSGDLNAVYFTLNPPALAPTVFGPIGVESEGLAAVTADGSRLFTTVEPSGGSSFDLYSVNPVTGAATRLGKTGFSEINGLFVRGTLYGFDDITSAVVTLDTLTGAATQVATYGLPNGDAIDASATPAADIGAANIPAATIPEPSSLAAFAIVGCAFAAWRRWKA